MLSNAESAEERPLLPATLEVRLARGAGRMGGYALLIAVSAAWVSLLTSSFADPSLSRVTGGAARNLLGAPGAAVSDLLIQTLGFAAVLVLLAPMFWGFELVLAGRVDKFRVKAAFFPLSVLVLAGAMSSLPTYAQWLLKTGYGGILGDVVYSFATSLVSLFSAPVAGAVTGLFLFAGGFAALAHSIGLAVSDLRETLRKKKPIDIEDTVQVWQDGLAVAKQGLRERMPSLSASRAVLDDDGDRWTKLRAEPMFETNRRHEARRASGDDIEATRPAGALPDDEDLEPEIDLDGKSDTAEASRIARKFAPKAVVETEREPVEMCEPTLRVPSPLGSAPSSNLHSRGASEYRRFSLNLLKRSQTAQAWS